MPKQDNDISIRSEAVQDVLSYVPGRIIRVGNMVIFGIMVMLFVISYLVKYPDVVSAEAVITTKTPTDNIIAKTNGKIEILFVNDNDYVKKNTPLAVIENSAAFDDVMLLKKVFDTVTIGKAGFHIPVEALHFLELGELLSDYAIFEMNYHAYESNRKLKPYAHKFDIDEIAIEENEKRYAMLEFQKRMSHRELELQRSEFNRSKVLYDQRVISAMEFEKSQLNFIQAEKAAENINALLSQIKETIHVSRKNRSGVVIEKIQHDSRLLTNTILAFYQVKKAIYDWESRYVLRSSIDGRVSFLSHWNVNQYIETGSTVFSVIPSGNLGYIGKLKAPIQNSGKLKVGQKVNIRLQNYPESEFGMLTGAIETISLVPDKDGFYHMHVKLESDLHTTYNTKIEFKQEMKGSAEIITEERRLLERFFMQIKRNLDP